MNWTFATFLLIVIVLITSVMFEGTSNGGNVTIPSFPPNNTVGRAVLPGVEPACSVDTECVPKTCCHPSACVHASQQPDCSDIYCTADCKPNTIDCGQGACKCMNQKCVVLMGE